jgi:hypothetical protein
MNFSATAPSTVPVSTPKADPAPEAVTSAPTVVEKQQVAAPSQNNSGIEGEVTSSDIRPPRISLVQKISDLSEQFDTGTFVFDKTAQLNPDPATPINATILRFRKYYQEKLPFGTEQIPLRYSSAREVRENGGSTTFGDSNYFAETADLLLAIEMPESIDEEFEAYFHYVCEGKNYALALYTINSSAFTSLGKKIITDSTMLLKDGLWTGEYKITGLKKTSPKGAYYVPEAKFSKTHSPEAIAFFHGMSGR